MNIYNDETNLLFLNLYRQLEEIRENKGDVYSFYKNKYYEQLNSYREIRNYLTHEQYKGTYPIAVSNKVCLDFESIINRMKENVYSRCNKNIEFLSLNDSIATAIASFINKGYTYLPLLDSKRRVLGIISSRSLLKLTSIDNLNKKEPLSNYLGFFSFEVDTKRFLFLSRSTPLSVAEKEFASIKNKKRLGMIFINENGKEDESLLGILSIYDITSLN